MAGSVAGGLYTASQNRKRYARETAQREDSYRRYLSQQEDLLRGWLVKQTDASLEPNPTPLACVERARTRQPSLWEREPSHDDFLALRLGTGRVRATFSVKAPQSHQVTSTPDPLIGEAQALAAKYAELDHLAVTLSLKKFGAAACVGPRARLLEAARALIVQLATHHSPDDVRLALLMTDVDQAHWAWARWLPHVWADDHSRRLLGAGPQAVRSLLDELEAVLKTRRSQRQTSFVSADTPLPALVVVFTDPSLWTGAQAALYGPVLDLILREGASLGAYALFLADRAERVPKGCGAIVEVGDDTANLRVVGPLSGETSFVSDHLDLETADRFARSLAPIRLGSLVSSEDVPSRVALLDLFGVRRAEDVPVAALWQRRTPFHSLDTPIGLRAGDKLMGLNLQEASVPGGFGSHALVGGTTGTGKTQFLQTMIVLLCAHYHPEDVTFVLIDYKGGDLARGLEALPHLVGSLANLEKQARQAELVERLFVSIDVEITRRKNMLRGEPINAYQERRLLHGSGEPALPHLFVVIDEFAELIRKNPQLELPKRFLTLGETGRSVGVHLILATQSPGNVVQDDLRAVINTRICLRMGSIEASQQILRQPDAYTRITKDQVGRAYLQVGNNDLYELFQVAWGGAPQDAALANAPDYALEIKAVDLDGRRHILSSSGPAAGVAPGGRPSPTRVTQLDALVAQICREAEALRVTPHTPVWLPPLPDTVRLQDLWPATEGWNGQGWAPSLAWLAPIVGLVDRPAERQQTPLRLDLSKNLKIFGAPGSGKSTLIQTLILSLTRAYSPRELHLYLVDYGSRSLRMLAGLPQVGAVILGDEHERLHRLIRLIDEELNRRQALLEGWGSLAALRQHDPESAPAEIVIVVDNFASLQDAVKGQMQQIEVEALTRLASVGGSVGIHLVIATDMAKSFPSKLSEGMGQAMALKLNDATDYLTLVGRDGLLPQGNGRGLFNLTPLSPNARPLEFQTAEFSGGATEAERAADLQRWIQDLRQAWHAAGGPRLVPPQPHEVSPDTWSDDQRPSDRAGELAAPLGLDLMSPELRPAWVTLTPGSRHILTGPPSTGRGQLLQTLLLSLAERYTAEELKFFVFDLGGSDLSMLAGLPHVLRTVTSPADLGSLDLPAEWEDILSPATSQRPPHLMVVLDGIATLKKTATDHGLTDKSRDYLIQRLHQSTAGLHVIAVGNPLDLSVAHPLTDALKQHQTGFWIGGSSPDKMLFNTPLRPIDQAALGIAMPETAILFQGGRYRLIRLAIPAQGPAGTRAWVQRIIQKETQQP